MEDGADEQLSTVDRRHRAALQHGAIVRIHARHHRLLREDVLDAQDLPEEGETSTESAVAGNPPRGQRELPDLNLNELAGSAAAYCSSFTLCFFFQINTCPLS